MLPKINIAICGPLSGPRSAYGEILIKESTNLVKRNNINIRYFDDHADPIQAVKIAHLITNEGFHIVLGHFNSFCSLAVKDIYQNANIGFIAPLSTNSSLHFSHGGALFSPSDLEQENILKKLISANKKIISLSDDTNYANELNHQLKENFASIININDFLNNSNINISEYVCFLSGIHSNLIHTHILLRKKYKNINIICCDDCCIDEYFSALQNDANDFDYIITQHHGHRATLQKSFKYVELLLDNFPEINSYFELVGKDFGEFKFTESGRLQDAKWSLSKLDNFIH